MIPLIQQLYDGYLSYSIYEWREKNYLRRHSESFYRLNRVSARNFLLETPGPLH